jgi:hypothetical protein
VALLAGAIVAPVAGARVPQGWVGTSVSPDETATPDRSAREWNRMVTSGVQAARAAFVWSRSQPYESYSSSDFPQDRAADFQPGADNVPTDFRVTDQVVRLAAGRGVRVLPVVLEAPGWAAAGRQVAGTITIPKDNNTYGNFLRTLIRRYGPDGTFWADNPDLPKRPIRQWQVWNEPNIPYFWAGNSKTWRDQFVKLLKVAHDAIKQEDPGAKVVLAGLSNYRHASPWNSLDQIYNNRLYSRRTMRSLFDVSAVHPYTLLTRNVVRIATYMRNAMSRNGDKRKQQMITELSWPSSKLPNGHDRARHNTLVDVTEREQAAKIAAMYPLLAHYRNILRIGSVYWYTWITTDKGSADGFDYAGLRSYVADSDSRAKPSYFAWAKVVRGLEGCRNAAKPSVTECG